MYAEAKEQPTPILFKDITIIIININIFLFNSSNNIRNLLCPKKKKTKLSHICLTTNIHCPSSSQLHTFDLLIFFLFLLLYYYKNHYYYKMIRDKPIR